MKRAVMGALVVLALAAPLGAAEKVTELKAFWRQGQTFLTWKELGDVEKEAYRLYQSDKPITPANVKAAKELATVPEGSCVNQWELKHRRRGRKSPLEAHTGIDGYGHRFCIVDNPANDPKKMLPVGTGLFVNTTHKDGAVYYAVAPDGKPELMAALAKPVDEKVVLPGAVLQSKHKSGTGLVYTHWMDCAKWKPFREGYAYNFGIGLPTGYDGKDALPVQYYGHGMGQGYRAPSKALYIKALWIWHGDKSGSWFFGMMNRDKTKVVNYVEQRVRWSYEWLKAGRPNQPFRIKPKLVNAHGHSMGGTMCTAFALRLGDIFSLTVSSAGATIHRRNRTWVGQASRLWGPVAKNLPTVDGTGVWDHQDYAQWSLKHVEQETAFLLISNGKRDGSVVFEPFPDFIDALQRSKRPFAATWNMRGHSWSGYGTRNGRWSAYQLANDESLPALGNASNNGDPRKDNSGTVNGNLEWSCAGNDFAKGNEVDDLFDTEKEWACNIRSLTGPATVDVTPRKCRKFKGVAGRKYAWRNIDFSDPKNPKVVDTGTVTADRYGLVTVEKLKVGKAGLGNRLVIRPAR